MKELGSCVGPISGEHIISEAVIRVLMADGDSRFLAFLGLKPAKQGFSRRKISKRTAFASNITARFILSMTLLNIYSLRSNYT
jgi:hypothetical protein